MRVFVDSNGDVIDFRGLGSSIYDEPSPAGTVRVVEFDETKNARVVALLASSHADSREFSVSENDELVWKTPTMPIVKYTVRHIADP